MTSNALQFSDEIALTDSWQGDRAGALLATDTQSRRVKVASLGKSEVRLTVDGQFPTWLDTVIADLNSAASLPANWDSYGARPVNQRTLEHALDVLLRVVGNEDPIPEILATSHGGIQFLWHKPGRELKVAINAPFQGEFYYSDDERDVEFEGPFSIEFGDVLQRLRDFAS